MSEGMFDEVRDFFWRNVFYCNQRLVFSGRFLSEALVLVSCNIQSIEIPML